MSSALPFVLAALLGLLAAGLLAAVTAFSPSYLASWAVAYLVLVVGVVQLILGVARVLLPMSPPAPSRVLLEAVGFNLGNLGVLFGQVASIWALTLAGALLQIITLNVMLLAVRGKTLSKGLLLSYRILIVVLLVSNPVGLLIAITSS